MHTMGWAHNDIKPDNVLLELRGGVVRFVLCDYGLASRHDRLDHPRGTDGYRFLYHQTRILACHSDFWSIGILSAEVLCGSPFIAPWDLPTLGQPASDQVTIDDFVLLKFRAFGVAQAAPMLRHVLVRDPSSKVNGLDPRLAREALGNVAAYVARLEVDEQFSIQGPIKIGRRKRLHDEVGPSERDPPVQAPASLAAATAPLPPPAVVKPCPDRERVPAHQLTVTKSQRMHMKRQARKVRWLARKALLDARPHGHGVDEICDSALDPTVPSNFENQPASNSVANRDH
jgi:serine/threonine protein kinase